MNLHRALKNNYHSTANTVRYFEPDIKSRGSLSRYAQYFRRAIAPRFHTYAYVTGHSADNMAATNDHNERVRIEQPIRQQLGITRFDNWPNGGTYGNIYWCAESISDAKRSANIEPLCHSCVNERKEIVTAVESGSNYDDSILCINCNHELSAYYENPDNFNETDDNDPYDI